MSSVCFDKFYDGTREGTAGECGPRFPDLRLFFFACVEVFIWRNGANRDLWQSRSLQFQVQHIELRGLQCVPSIEFLLQLLVDLADGSNCLRSRRVIGAVDYIEQLRQFTVET